MKKLITIAIIGSLLILAMALFSCGSNSKNKRSLSAAIDSTVLKQKEDLLRELREKILRLENELQEAQYTGFVFAPDADCDTAATRLLLESIKASYNTLTKQQADSFTRVLKAKENSVKFYADGSAEARGALQSANYSKTLLQRQLTVWMDKFDSLAYEHELLQKNVRVEIKEVVKEKRVVQFPWLLIVIALVVGLVLGVKYSKQIKFFISKIKL